MLLDKKELDENELDKSELRRKCTRRNVTEPLKRAISKKTYILYQKYKKAGMLIFAGRCSKVT